MKMLPVSHKPIEAVPIFQDHGHSPHLWWSPCNWRLGSRGGHLGSNEVANCFWPGLDLNWLEVKFWNRPFKFKKCMFPNRFDEANTMVSLFLYFHIKTILMISPWKTIFFHLMPSWPKIIDLRSTLIGKGYQSTKRAPKHFIEFFLVIVLEITAIVSEKIAIFTKFDLWWPLVTSTLPELKKIFVKIWDLVAVYLITFTAFRWVS